MIKIVGGKLKNRSHKSKEILLYTDDIVIIGCNKVAIRESFKIFENQVVMVKLQTNTSKLTFMTTCKELDTWNSITIEENNVEVVKSFNSLNANIIASGDISKEIRNRIMIVFRELYALGRSESTSRHWGRQYSLTVKPRHREMDID